MSNPAKSQQRFPFRIPVRIRRNYVKLPPITQKIRPIEQENESIKSPLSVVNVNVDIKCETPPVDTKDFWIKLREHIANETLEHRDNHGCQRSPNKVVRIFVSSTFTDFFNEREVLIKKVFPALRDEMEQIGIRIIDCDLRWGVPKDSTNEQTILTCLEELDRCFEDNGQPFFIGLVSDKYGWVPKLNELPTNIVERYRWIDGASITLMEFIHGAFRTHNPNAFFLIRKSENILKNLPDKYTDKFRDKDDQSQKQVNELKTQLSEIFPQEQIFHYDCFYNGLDSSTGRERVRIDGLHEFEEQAKKFLSQAIQKWYPDNFRTNESSNSNETQMTTFLLNKTQFFVDRPNELSALFQYITGDHKDLTLIDGSVKATENYHPLMALTGQSGDGKTMLLAKLVLNIQEKMKDKVFLFYYFLDGAFHANASQFMLTTLTQKINEYLEENNIISPKTGERLKVTDDTFLSDAIDLLSIPLVIIVDGLEKGDIHHKRNYNQEFPFMCRDSLNSDHTYTILSCETDSPLHQEICHYPHYQSDLQPLTIEQRSLYIENFFQHFNKTLEPEQKSLLVNNKGGEQPLYLSYICENLRQFGDYSLVTKRLKTYPQTIDELLDVLLNEVYIIIDNQPLVDAFFLLLIISNVGILESDIVSMLQHYMNKQTDEENPILINRMTWSTLRRNIKTFLDTTWIDGHQVIIFRHSTLEKKLRQRCLKEDTNEIHSLNSFMADFYLKYSAIKEFASRRAAYHYDQADMRKEIVTYLRSIDSRYVTRLDRQAYLRRIRCTKQLPPMDCPLNQRAYVCNVCAMQFKLGPFTMTKSSCLICTNMILGGNMGPTNAFKREARFCQKHGSPGYPNTFQCAICKCLRPKPTGTVPTMMDPVQLNICFDCWCAGGQLPHCCGIDIN